MSLQIPKDIPSYTLKADGIAATILPFGAVLQSLIVKDKDGKDRDVVVGFDDPMDYVNQRTFNGTVVGRYANRIKKGTFTIDGEEFHAPLNEKGKTALHGGNNGYDRYIWDVVSKSDSSITLSMLDKDGSEGFPGDVHVSITYTVSANPARFTVRLVSLSLTKKTPIMPTTHTYFNLSGFASTNILEDTLHMPKASRVVKVDEDDIPTGDFIEVARGGDGQYLNFTKSRQISDGDGPDAKFSPNGTGIDHAFAFDEVSDDAQIQWSNPVTGIRMSVKTNQQGVQIYTAKHLDGSTPLKKSQQGGATDKLQKFGCIAIEPQDWIDGINNPAWKRSAHQIFGPADGPCVNLTQYIFDTL